MTSLSRILQRFCAIAISGALVLAGIPATAQQPPAQSPPQSGPQPAPPQPAPQQLGQGQLEKLLAPIALYPDDLVAQILTASTYPLEVVEAARWVQEHHDLQGDALQNAMQQQSWEPSVKGLTAVPQVLAMMNDKLDWTQQVGEAFLAQPSDVSNAIQQLRAKAAANGNLKSSKQLKVSTVAAPSAPLPSPPPPGVDPAMLPPPPPADYIMIEPADPGLYYVPIYDPSVVYGPWPWPAYSPFYWYPPGFVLGAAALGFGVGCLVGAALWSHYNWAGGGVYINVARYTQFNRTHLVAGTGGFSNWQFNNAHRGVVGFQNATLRQQYGTTTTRSTFQGTLQGNAPSNLNRGGPGKLNANANANINRNVNVNKNVNIDRNINVDRNVNRNVNVNRSASFSRNVGRPAPGGNKKQH